MASLYGFSNVNSNSVTIIKMTRRSFASRNSVASILWLILSFFACDAAAAPYAALVIEANSDRVLFERNAHSQRHPASLTKMMTLYMVFEALDNRKTSLHKSLRVSRYAASRPASKLGLTTRDTITVEQAILALVTHSANDVATVIAEHLGGSEAAFARQMTSKARKLGMTRTVFRNASGLPNSAQVTTAWDMSRLAKALLRRFSHRYHYFATKNFRFRNRVYRNHNHLIHNYPGTDGIKTGYINASGYNLVAAVKRRGHRVIGVVFGGRSARSRDAHMRKILSDGFAELRHGTTRPRFATINPHRGTGALPIQKIARVSRRDSSWKVQVGAFRNFRNAEKRLTQARKLAPSYLGRARDNITLQARGNRKLYIASYHGLSREQANSACRELKRKNLDCMTIH